MPNKRPRFSTHTIDMTLASTAENYLALYCKSADLVYCTESRFHPKRRWRFDFLVTHLESGKQCAVEIEGLTNDGGRHQRMQGYQKDCEKYNEAALLGYTVFRFTRDQVLNGEMLDVISRFFHESK